jgi:hypothetical protein
LGYVAGVSWECGVWDIELGGSGFGENDIVRFKEATYALPGVELRY